MPTRNLDVHPTWKWVIDKFMIALIAGVLGLGIYIFNDTKSNLAVADQRIENHLEKVGRQVEETCAIDREQEIRLRAVESDIKSIKEKMETQNRLQVEIYSILKRLDRKLDLKSSGDLPVGEGW